MKKNRFHIIQILGHEVSSVKRKIQKVFQSFIMKKLLCTYGSLFSVSVYK